MTATILTHPRLDAASRERLTDRLADLLAHEERLRWQAVPEAEAVYWQLFGDLEVWPAARAGVAERRAARRTRARIAAAARRRGTRVLPAHARRVVCAAHRRVVRCLHPLLDPEADAHAPLWAMAQRACRDGDLQLLHACESAVGGPNRSAALTGPALRRALAATQARIRRLEAGFPLNLRARMADAAWVARRRAALRGRLKPAGARGPAGLRRQA